MDQTPTGSISRRDFAVIVILGLILGTGNAFLIEFVPEQSRLFEGTVESFGAYFSFGLLGFSAFLAFALSGYVSRIGFRKVIVPSSLVIILMVGLLLLTTNRTVFISGSVLLAIAFGMLNISALPFAISKLPTRILTLGIGIFLGATFLIEGLLEYIYI